MSARWVKVAAGMYRRAASGYTASVARDDETGRWGYHCQRDGAPALTKVIGYGDAATMRDAKREAAAMIRVYHAGIRRPV